MEVYPPKCLEESLYVPHKTLMGPGPSNPTERVLEALSNPVLGHFHPECFEIMDEIKEGLKYIFQTRNHATMCVSGSGHAGLEMALCNLIEDGDVVLVANTGIWAHRAADMVQRLGGDVRFVQTRFAQSLTLEEIQFAFEGHKPQIFFIAHGDSSTGILQNNIKEIGELCRQYNCLLIVDAVVTVGAVEFRMDDWNVDVAYTGSQKAIGAPPGITPISFSQRAISHVLSRKTRVKSYYLDVMLLGQYWNCFAGKPRIYHHTICSTLLYGLREALALICAQTLPVLIQRHRQVSEYLQEQVEEMGLEMFLPNPDDRLPTVNTVKIPPGVNWRKVSEYAMNKYQFEISGGLGPTVEQVFRIGLMGSNATVEKVNLLLRILHEAIRHTNNNNTHKLSNM